MDVVVLLRQFWVCLPRVMSNAPLDFSEMVWAWAMTLKRWGLTLWGVLIGFLQSWLSSLSGR